MIRPDDLLAPVPGDRPNGTDLHNPNRQPPLNDARAALRAARRHDESGQPADWAEVQTLAATVLIEHSKDLEAAGYLAEALVHTQGFAGLAAAADLLAGLVERFWSGLFPDADADDPTITAEEARLDPLRRLVEDRAPLLVATSLAVLFTLDDGTAMNCLACQGSKSWTARPPAERAKHPNPAGGTRPWDAVVQLARGLDAVGLAETRDTIAEALAGWRGVEAAVAAQVGPDRFSCRPLLDLLNAALGVMRELAPDAPPEGSVELVAAAPSAAAGIPVAPPPPAAVRAVTDREEALRQLAEITAFFRRTEPFSPVALTLDEAMRRARLPWMDWLAEAVPDETQRTMVLTRLGLRPEPRNG